jgi:hypothetical protein
MEGINSHNESKKCLHVEPDDRILELPRLREEWWKVPTWNFDPEHMGCLSMQNINSLNSRKTREAALQHTLLHRTGAARCYGSVQRNPSRRATAHQQCGGAVESNINTLSHEMSHTARDTTLTNLPIQRPRDPQPQVREWWPSPTQSRTAEPTAGTRGTSGRRRGPSRTPPATSPEGPPPATALSD